MTHFEIGKVMGISSDQVRMIERRALGKLRQHPIIQSMAQQPLCQSTKKEKPHDPFVTRRALLVSDVYGL